TIDCWTLQAGIPRDRPTPPVSSTLAGVVVPPSQTVGGSSDVGEARSGRARSWTQRTGEPGGLQHAGPPPGALPGATRWVLLPLVWRRTRSASTVSLVRRAQIIRPFSKSGQRLSSPAGWPHSALWYSAAP